MATSGCTSCCSALRQAGQLQEIRLEPLSDAETARLAQEAAGGVLPPPDAGTCRAGK